MKYTIEIQPAGVKYQSEGNLLDDALSASLPIEHSCKTGDCGVCSAEVIDGSVENEKGDVVTSGYILTCQSRAKSDIALKANYYPELVNIKQQTIPCKVASVELVTEDIILIKFRFPPTVKFNYLPGQYIDLNYNGVKRSYSIANAKSDLKELELHIRQVANGKMSELLFNGLKENQLMRMEGPKGTFFVKDNNKTLVLLATGTGIAPIKAIVEELVAKKDKRDVHIYWGMQYEKELYCNELIELAQRNEHISFTPVLSRETTAPDGGELGYVQNKVIKDFDSFDNIEVYACGSIRMIEEAKSLLLQHGLPENSFFSDAFTPAK